MNPDQKPTTLTVIFGGEEVLSSYLDGTKVLVRVRAMPVRHLGHLLKIAEREAELIEFVCMIPREQADAEKAVELQSVFPGWCAVAPGWADNLSDASHAALLEAAQRQNFSRAANWAERQIAAKKFTTPINLKADEALQPLVQRTAELLLSSLPALASSKSATSTKS